MTTGAQLRTLREKHGIGLRRMAARIHYTPGYLSLIENGHKPVSVEVEAAYERAITDHSDADTNRRRMLKLSASTGVDLARVQAASASPAGAGRSAVVDLRTVIDRMRHLEDQVGSQYVLPVVTGVDAVAQMMAKESGNSNQAGVFAAEVALYRGWLELDVGNPARADAGLDVSAKLAEQFNDPTQLAHARSFRAYSARRQGKPGAALELTEIALAVRRAHPILEVYDRFQRAELLAIRGDTRRAEGALLAADRAGERAADIDLPSFGYWYTPGFWGLQRGIVLSALGRKESAINEATQGLNALPVEHRSAEWVDYMLEQIDPDWTQ